MKILLDSAYEYLSKYYDSEIAKNKGGSINSFYGIFEFVSSRLPYERKAQNWLCSQMTNSKMLK